MRFDQKPRISTKILGIAFQDTVFDDMPKDHRVNATSVVGEEHEVKRRIVAIFGIQPREQRKPSCQLGGLGGFRRRCNLGGFPSCLMRTLSPNSEHRSSTPEHSCPRTTTTLPVSMDKNSWSSNSPRINLQFCHHEVEEVQKCSRFEIEWREYISPISLLLQR